MAKIIQNPKVQHGSISIKFSRPTFKSLECKSYQEKEAPALEPCPCGAVTLVRSRLTKNSLAVPATLQALRYLCTHTSSTNERTEFDGVSVIIPRWCPSHHRSQAPPFAAVLALQRHPLHQARAPFHPASAPLPSHHERHPHYYLPDSLKVL